MTGAWHGGKGSLTRKEAKPGSYAENYERIERAREIQSRLCRCQTTDQRRHCADRHTCLRAEATHG